MKIGLLPLGRPTFDVPFAEEKLAGQLAQLDSFAAAHGYELTGSRLLLMDGDATQATMDAMEREGIDRLLVLQVTFTDAAMVAEAARRFQCPVSIWAVREPRDGDRLRLNAFCGLNLASHALGLADRAFSWALDDALTIDQLTRLLSGKHATRMLEPDTAGAVSPEDLERGRSIVDGLTGKRIARLGEHPVGFDTCAYDEEALGNLCGVSVDALELDSLFSVAKEADAIQVAPVRQQAMRDVQGLDAVDQDELDRSLRLKVALNQLREKGDYSAFAIRCWPETFTEYGGAVCGPVSQMGEARVPCACEADVLGALTQMILQEAAQAPVFLTDLVDMDEEDDTGVVWHCGQAPVSMRAESDAGIATIHTNRKMPLLYEFSLKEGPVTLVRLSQAHGDMKLIISRATMLDRPRAYTGTSGVLRFERPVSEVLPRIMDSGLEHHMALAYGDHTAVLHGVAAALNLPVLEL